MLDPCLHWGIQGFEEQVVMPIDSMSFLFPVSSLFSDMHPALLVFISLALGFAATLLFRMSARTRVFAFLVAAFLFIVLSISIVYLVADFFTGRGIDESVVFHLRYGLRGAGHGEYTHVAALALISLYLGVNSLLFAFLHLSQPSLKRSGASTPLGIALLACAIVINPGVGNLCAFITHEFLVDFDEQSHATSGDKLFQQDTLASVRSDQLDEIRSGQELGTMLESEADDDPMNIVYIYLEGLEQTYFDETLFPGLLPRLNRIRNRGLSFTDIRQVYGTGWTIAGMVASQCGVPLVTTSDHHSMNNAMAGMNEFLPSAVCLGDILGAHGYTLSYLGGASLEFAGKGRFYQTHGFSRVYGLEEILARGEDTWDALHMTATGMAGSEQKPAGTERFTHSRPIRWVTEHVSALWRPRLSGEDHVHTWGIHDDMLFDHATQIFLDLASHAQPFALFLLTLDTHHPTGHISPSCEEIIYADGGNPMLNAVHCADFLVSGFLEQIMASEHAGNTLIVVSSDHLALRNTATDLLDQGNRRNLFFILHPGMDGGAINERIGSMLDVGPTLLGLLGSFEANQDDLGFGQDLLDQTPNLMERFTDVDAFLRSQREQLTSLWDLPGLDGGFLVDAHQGRVEFDNRSINLPVLLTLDAALSVREIFFDINSNLNLKDYLRDFAPDQAWIWIDTCRNIAATALAHISARRQDMCVAMGRLNATQIPWEPVHGTRGFTKSTVEEALKENTDMARDKLRRSRLRNLSLFDVLDLEELPSLHLADFRIDGTLVVSSVGGLKGGRSNVVGMGSNQKTVLELDRGLHLIGIGPDATPVRLASMDSCLPNDVNSIAEHPGSFVRTMQQHFERYSVFLIVIHDTGKCEKDFNTNSLFNGLPLEKWTHLDHRQPYIGVFSGQDVFYEGLGNKEDLLRHVIR